MMWGKKKEKVKDPRAEAFFRRVIHTDPAKLKPVKKINADEAAKPLQEMAKKKAKELGVSPGLLYNALYYCVNDPGCDVEELLQKAKEGRDSYLLQFLRERGVEV
jgi:hypothetical protein